VLRLYVAGAAPHSAQALENLRAMCKGNVGDDYELQVIDVLRTPERALSDGILVTPTLVKVAPEPVRTIIGDLSSIAVVSRALGIPLGGGE
jgi:circadian clock protein KaiB